MSEVEKKPTLLFETSWEVCNKVGGIYTVLSTKAKVLTERLGNKMIFIGPDVWSDTTPSPYFSESKTLLSAWRKSRTLPVGISVRVGRWLVPGKPLAILVKFDSVYDKLNQVYADMWERYGVDSLHSYGDYAEGCAFAVAAAKVIDSYASYVSKNDDRVVAHFDEWTTAMGLLYIKAYAPKIATVFTTHATSIGRSICGNGKPLYDYFEGYNGDQMAVELNMQSKHSLEKAAAHNADCFTTVSEITARECQQLLEIKPVVTPNGFESTFVPEKLVLNELRAKARKQLLNVAKALTGNNFPENTFLFATAGRNEYRNKGIDVFIDVVNKLRNQNISKSNRQSIAFILVPAWSDIARVDLLSNMNSKSKMPLEDPIITHTLHEYFSDTIFNRLKYLGFRNADNDSVVVIYVPCYLNGDDGIFNMAYYDLLTGMDAVVFPSYYEPWGYTPQEGIAFGVPTITTDLAGFGQWIMSDCSNGFDKSGVEVVSRTDSNYEKAVGDIAGLLIQLMRMSIKSMDKIKRLAVSTAKKTEWSKFIVYYDKAYETALTIHKNNLA